MRLEPAAARSDAELAALFSAGYEDYFTPLQVDERGFRSMVDAWDVDLELSRVAVAGDGPAGICTVGVRGDQAWIGGLGVVVRHRREGVGAVLMRRVIAEARERGARDLWLEVLVENEPAIRLYERLGFEHVRDLEVWTLDDLVTRRHTLPPLALAEALGREERPPWQRADATVRKGDAEALGGDRGVLVHRVTGSVSSLLQCAADDADAAAGLLRALPPEVTSVRWLNGPEGHPLNEALARLGGTLAHRQHELLLAL